METSVKPLWSESAEETIRSYVDTFLVNGRKQEPHRTPIDSNGSNRNRVVTVFEDERIVMKEKADDCAPRVISVVKDGQLSKRNTPTSSFVRELQKQVDSHIEQKGGYRVKGLGIADTPYRELPSSETCYSRYGNDVKEFETTAYRATLADKDGVYVIKDLEMFLNKLLETDKIERFFTNSYQKAFDEELFFNQLRHVGRLSIFRHLIQTRVRFAVGYSIKAKRIECQQYTGTVVQIEKSPEDEDLITFTSVVSLYSPKSSDAKNLDNEFRPLKKIGFDFMKLHLDRTDYEITEFNTPKTGYDLQKEMGTPVMGQFKHLLRFTYKSQIPLESFSKFYEKNSPLILAQISKSSLHL